MARRKRWSTWAVAVLAPLLIDCSGGPQTEPSDVSTTDVDAAQPEDDADAQTAADTDPDTDTAPDAVDEESCELNYELPDGDAFALYTDEIREPESVVSLAAPFMGDTPPMVMFVDGLTDGMDDSLQFVGGFGERTGVGYDEIPDTHEDVYALYYGALSPERCDYRVQLDGRAVERELSGHAESVELDLDGLSSLTAGVIVEVVDVEATGSLESGLMELHDVVLSGVITDEGFDALIDAVQEQVPVSREQARDILDPDGEGEILIEMVMSGRRVVVDGFTDAEDDSRIDPRPEAGDCCPDGLEVGESVLPHLAWEQQGIDERQAELFAAALPEFRADPHVAMVATARRADDGSVQYEVYSGGAIEEGKIIYERTASDSGDAPDFEIVEQVGTNPLENTDPTALSSYEEFLQTGTNPGSVTYPDRGYGEDDERLGFVPAAEMHYPFAMERIAQNFDDPRAGDLMIIPATWSTGGFGTHGSLGALQSRAPLVISGPGIRRADGESQGTDEAVEELGSGAETLLIDGAVRQVDIAPTVAAALGVDKTTGVGPDLRLRDDLYLGWQDGRVLDEIFTDEARAKLDDGEPVAERALIIVNDGLTNPELFFQVFSDDSDFEVDVYRRLFASGLAYRHGAIANFPSNTFPGHNTIGTGAWSGHHGIVDNHFWEREQAASGTPGGEVFETEYMFGSAHSGLPVETLHEAVTRTFGGLAEGVVAASINTPSSRGASVATFERRRPEGFELPDEGDNVTVGAESYSLPPVDVEDHTEVMDNSTSQNFAAVYQDHLVRGEEGLPVPKYSVVNFASTDTAGHRHGPHGDEERYGAIPRTNQRMEVIFAVLEELDILESTLVVLTADHGMELQDRDRSSSRAAALAEADVSVRTEGWHVYFKEFFAELKEVVDEGEHHAITLRIVDRATRDTEEPVGVEHVSVDVVDGGEAQIVQTDRDGVATIEVVVDGEAEGVLFEFDHGQWNSHRERFQLP